MSVSLKDAVARLQKTGDEIKTRNSSLASTPREDGLEWNVTRIPEVSQAEKNRIRKKLPKL